MTARGLKSFGVFVFALVLCFGLTFGESAFAKEKSKPASESKSKDKPKAGAKGKGSAKSKDKAKEEEAASALQKKTWALRDHFKFPQGKTLFRYAVEDCQWSVELGENQVAIDNAKFEITFGDGTTLDSSGLGKAENSRDKFTNEIGAGVAYANTFPAKDGLIVRHSVSMFNERMFFLIGVGIGNSSEKPVEIAKITLASFAPGGITCLSGDTRFSSRRLDWRGGCPVFRNDGPSMLSILEDPTKGVTFSFGILPQGAAQSSVNLAANNGSYVGDITCVYDPPIRIEPGQKIESDQIWCTLAVPAPTTIDENYAWCLSVLHHPSGKERVRAWASAGKNASQSDLVAVADAWKGIVKHVLVPGTWEGRPGSLDGGTPNFPKDMGKLAKQLSAAGMTPGITVDPLMTSGGGSAWVAKSADGTSWLNLSAPEARKQAVERMKKVVGWGYMFFVVSPSGIPNEVLKQFNITRAQADSAAVAVMAEASGGLPVFAQSSCLLKASGDAWLEGAAAENRLASFDVPVGALRFDVGGLQSLDDNTVTAMSLVEAPIEFIGVPKGQLAGQLSRILADKAAGCFPLDASSSAPKLWTATMLRDGATVGQSVVALQGARAWKLEELGLGEKADVIVWRAADGQVVDAAKGAITSDGGLSVYGVAAKAAHPVLMGASARYDLLLNDMKSLAWDEQKGILSGAFGGKNSEKAKAYVWVPDGWALTSGRAGEQNVSKKEASGVIEFGVASGGPTKFELKFGKK